MKDRIKSISHDVTGLERVNNETSFETVFYCWNGCIYVLSHPKAVPLEDAQSPTTALASKFPL
jgi:hypothetical protein